MKRRLFFLLILIVFSSCSRQKENKNEVSEKNSIFDLNKKLLSFSNEMTKMDTLIILADFSIGLSYRTEKNILFKNKGKIFLKTILESQFKDSQDIVLPIVEYNFKGYDTLTFEKLFENLKSKNHRPSKFSFPIFTITNKKDTIYFFNDGLLDKIEIGEYYIRIMQNLYPKEKVYEKVEILKVNKPIYN